MAIEDLAAPRSHLISSGDAARTAISAAEQETISLPAELVKVDRSLDVYEDVLKLFRPTYTKNQPAIQCAGWVGYIPLNNNFALEVKPRVSVGNLERLIGMAAGYTPNILRKYTRRFSHTIEQPASLVDILADQILDAFEAAWQRGLFKSYQRVNQVGSSPTGRIMPFHTEWLMAKSGRPLAVSSAFHRTADFGPNRVLRHAFERLLARYSGVQQEVRRRRIRRLQRAVERLRGVTAASAHEMTPEAIASFIDDLPRQHENYADALMVAQIITAETGLSIRGTSGDTIMSSILIDMATVFEDYVRRMLANGLRSDAQIEVRDGNKRGEGGAKMKLFDPGQAGLPNPSVTPDIVIDVEGRTQLIIDVKYKRAPTIPDRNDINQVVLYGARYDCDRIMLLHADKPNDSVRLCGEIGRFQVYNGMIDLNASPMEEEESQFVTAVRALL